MERLRDIAIIVLFVLLTSNGLSAENPKTKSKTMQLKQLMTVTDFKDCGLDKLSDEELSNLESWMENYTLRGVRLLNKSSSTSTPDVIESQIEGDFEGWSGETIFKLENGQIWQQSSYDYTYSYSYRPSVLIYKTGGGYKMKVEDVDETIYVKRLK